MKLTRRIVQAGFLALVLIGVFLWQANCERWCPFGGVEALYTYAAGGDMVCSLGTSNFFILGGVLLMTLLLRRAFCGYACPLGTLSQWLFQLARWVRIPAVRRVPTWLDRLLRLLKYAVLAVILWLTWQAGELIFRGFDPCYALIGRHGEDITIWAYVVAGVLAAGSLAVALPLCRWLCPMAAVLNPFSRFGLTRIQRNEASCQACGLCARECPMDIPVDRLPQVTASRCISCLSCAAACPQQEAVTLAWGPFKRLSNGWSQAALVVILLACTGAAVAASYAFPLPSFVTSRGTPPPETAAVDLEIVDLTCRGKANRLVFFLTRDDEFQIPGYLRLEAWPGPGVGRVRVVYDPALTKEDAIKQAITESYFDIMRNRWWAPFQIEGYDPLDDEFGEL